MTENNSFDQKNVSVGVIGDLMLDEYILGHCVRISPEAPVPVVKLISSEFRAGGAANVAINLQSLGAETKILGILGNDSAGDELGRIFFENNITNLTVRSNTVDTILKQRIVSKGQQLLRLDKENSLEKYSIIAKNELQPIAREIIESVSILVLSDYLKGCLYDPTDLIREAKRAGVPVVVDPKGQTFDKYAGAYLLTPNLMEFTSVVGEISSYEDMVQKAQCVIKKNGFQALVITRGEDGVTLVTPCKHVSFQSVAKEVYDVTGAGDTLIAALSYCLALKFDLERSVEIANRAASLIVSKFGTASLNQSEINSIFNTEVGLNWQHHNPKILKGKEEIERLRSECSAINQNITVTNGCFDIVHAGHIHMLQEASSCGDILVVLLNSDESVKRLKGKTRPINCLSDRLSILCALECVDYIYVFGEDTPIESIRWLKPDTLMKGNDYEIDEIIGAELVQSYGGKVKTVPLLEGRSTTKLANKVNRG
jgi:D-beta-D-heptose 7-phosphate kinase / D-beta-D-heptose 1-phosphate adenosyltransferase